MTIEPPFVRTPALAALPNARHGFFGREGGVSVGALNSLNVSLKREGESSNARENRRRIAAALGSLSPPLVPRQVHGTRCLAVRAPWPDDDPPEADALATDRPGLLLGVTSADCVPVLFADPQAGVVAAAHAGWRGAVAGVLEGTLEAMRGLGADPGRVVAAIGPCIRPSGYEVGPELREQALERHGWASGFFERGRGDRFLFDLPGLCAALLRRAGAGVVEDAGEDTLGQPERYFSYRRATLAGESAYGLQLSAVALKA